MIFLAAALNANTKSIPTPTAFATRAEGCFKQNTDGLKRRTPPMTTDNHPKTDRDILTRYAAVIPVFVDAGCEPPMHLCEGREATIEVEIAVLEQWFTQTVVPWADEGDIASVVPPRNIPYTQWKWFVFTNESERDKNGSDPDPTEANIQCIEALAEVIGASDE
jgi:hypothetical protein